MRNILISGTPWNIVTATRGLSPVIHGWMPISTEAWAYGEVIVSVIISKSYNIDHGC